MRGRLAACVNQSDGLILRTRRLAVQLRPWTASLLARTRSSRGGFTLIEALVAFAVLALGLSSLLQGVGGGARNESRADFLLRATRQGQSQLAALGSDTPLAPGQASGRYDDGLLWNLSVEPHRVFKAPAGAAGAASLLARLVIRKPVPGAAALDTLVLTTIKLIAIDARQP